MQLRMGTCRNPALFTVQRCAWQRAARKIAESTSCRPYKRGLLLQIDGLEPLPVILVRPYPGPHSQHHCGRAQGDNRACTAPSVTQHHSARQSMVQPGRTTRHTFGEVSACWEATESALIDRHCTAQAMVLLLAAGAWAAVRQLVNRLVPAGPDSAEMPARRAAASYKHKAHAMALMLTEEAQIDMQQHHTDTGRLQSPSCWSAD